MARKLNKALLRRLARKLRRLRHEEHYDQGKWFSRTDCGSAACIAGHAGLMCGWRPSGTRQGTYGIEWWSKGRRKDVHASAMGALVFGLPDTSWRLFGPNPEADWPEPYRSRWASANPDGPHNQRPSRVAADLLDALADGKVEPF